VNAIKYQHSVPVYFKAWFFIYVHMEKFALETSIFRSIKDYDCQTKLDHPVHSKSLTGENTYCFSVG